MPSYDEYIAEWNGRQITKYGGECVAGIAEYESENGLPIIWGDAHTWINNPTMLGAYDWIANNPSDPNQVPSRGDIIIWPLPNEHIAFFDQNLGNHKFQSFGQNSGGRAMHFQPHNWSSNPAGWYHPKQAAPPPAEVHPYTIEEITPKEVQFNKDTHRWGLHYDNFTAINNNPEAAVPVNSIVTARAILHHNIGYNYYLEDPSVPSGYNVLDCTDFNPPAPAPTPPPPPVEPPPLPLPPAGPLTAPSSETYEVIVEIPGYLSSNQALNHVNQKVAIPVGTYFVFNKRGEAVNITKKPGTPGAWVNTNDNVLPPPPPTAAELAAEEAAKAAVDAAERAKIPDFAYTYHAFEKPELYVAMRDLEVPDLTAERKTARIKKYEITWISGTFDVNGIDYALPLSAQEKGWWYGIEWTDTATNTPNLELESEVFNGTTTLEERQATKTLKKTDYILLGIGHIQNFILGFTQFLSKIRGSKVKNKQGKTS